MLEDFGFNIIPKSANIEDIEINEVLTNNEIVKTFKCGNTGGMRRSKRTNSLVLVVNHTKSIYKDKWVGNTLYYSGMGSKGNQELDKQNKTLFESNESDITIHLFEVIKEKEYIYRGIAKLSGNPFTEDHCDVNDELRKVWVFPLEIINNLEVTFEEIKNINNNVVALCPNCHRKVHILEDSRDIEKLKNI